MSSEERQLELQGEVWMTMGGQHLGGPDRVALLAAIAEHGSITKAAKAIKMSYKAAWDAIDAMNNLAGEPLVERLAGGKGGGGTHLTKRGTQLVENFRQIEREHRLFIEHLSRQSHALADDFLLLQTMRMKTSARNQFAGTVSVIKRGAVNDEITLDIVGGQKIIAIITRDSTDSLGLTEGCAAFALIKASSIIIATGDSEAKLSARNRLCGTVSRLQTGAVNSDVSIALPGGGTIAATVTRDSEELLELEVGMPASALFKASAVIIGVPG
ncbi:MULTISPECIES: TOBE domain-containing protein [unclassified Massilia]|uniref:TOBE domain-containing protein n=1 Tax=unclassified Massilia TaxID=2609279 RepID=UPI00067B6B59|nr:MULTISPECIES: TOBE domain-containing protein [unclassified Massilia]AKU21742.1 ModE family transcriptional regulator [Massilia sp. NR 4-1]UMR28645.1 TOBE domain-containing protein [Massilia sp. MB5]UTY60322.1 TOBE domain-containing protein [Massilia sp. erpn]